jgi:hypothetical protein
MAGVNEREILKNWGVGENGIFFRLKSLLVLTL